MTRIGGAPNRNQIAGTLRKTWLRCATRVIETLKLFDTLLVGAHQVRPRPGGTPSPKPLPPGQISLNLRQQLKTQARMLLGVFFVATMPLIFHQISGR